MLENLKTIAASITLNERQLIIILGILAFIDIVTGLINAAQKGNIQSSIMREGLTKKAYEFILVGLAAMLDVMLNVHFIAISTLVWFCIEELISILENCGEYLPIPEFLKEAIKKLRQLYEKEDKE